MRINYIYDPNGALEYALVPIELWERVQHYLPQNMLDAEVMPSNNSFEPNDYVGMLSHLGLDMEQEITNMRSEWAIRTI